MKNTVIAVFAYIIGSNAELLNPLTNTVDAIIASTQANGLLNLFQSQIALNGATASSKVTLESQQLVVAFQNLTATFHGVLNQNGLNASDLIIELTKLFADLNANSTYLVTQVKAAIGGLNTQINNLVNPSITKLTSSISSGVTKLKCFTDKVPRINENIAEVVGVVNSYLTAATGKLTKNAQKTKQSFSEAYVETLECGLNPLCYTRVVSYDCKAFTFSSQFLGFSKKS